MSFTSYSELRASPRISVSMRWHFVIACLVVMTIGAGLRTFHLGADCFDCDELYAVRIQGLSPKSIAAVMARDGFHTNHPPLMTVPFLAWTAALGTSETAVRGLPLAAGELAVGAVIAFGWALGRPRAGLIGAFLLAINPLHITYSAEARQYALVTALLAVAHVLFVLALRYPRRGLVLAFYLIAAWAALTHYFAVPVLMGHAAGAAWIMRRPGPQRLPAARLFLSVGLAGLPYLAWLPVIRFQTRMKWEHLAPLTPDTFFDSLADLFGVGGGRFGIGFELSICLLALAAGGVWAARSSRVAIGRSTPRLVPAWLGWCILAVGAAAGIAFAAAFPKYVEPIARQTLSGYGYDPALVEEELSLLRQTAILGAGCLALGGAVILLWQRAEALLARKDTPSPSEPSTSAATLLTFFLLTPVAVIGLASLTGIRFHQTRNLLVLLPALCMAWGFALDRLGRTLPGSIVAVVLLVFLTFSAFQYQAVGRVIGRDGPRLGIDTIDWRGVRDWLDDHEDGRTIVLVKRPATDPALYYLATFNPIRVTGDNVPTLPPRLVFVHLTGNAYSEKARDAIPRPLAKEAEGDGWEVYVKGKE